MSTLEIIYWTGVALGSVGLVVMTLCTIKRLKYPAWSREEIKWRLLSVLALVPGVSLVGLFAYERSLDLTIQCFNFQVRLGAAVQDPSLEIDKRSGVLALLRSHSLRAPNLWSSLRRGTAELHACQYGLNGRVLSCSAHGVVRPLISVTKHAKPDSEDPVLIP